MSVALRPAPRRVETRSLAGVAVFWMSSLAVGGATFAVLALLAPHLPAGGLAAVSVVLGLSYVLAVPPGAIQMRATEVASERSLRLALAPPRFVAALGVVLLLASPLLARALEVPIAAVALACLQLPLAAALGSARGTLIGQRRLPAAASTFALDATCRLLCGLALGLLWGAAGVAGGLVLATLVPLVIAQPRLRGERTDAVAASGEGSMLAYALAISVIMLLTNIDVLLGKRVLGGGADAYAVASLPAKGVFFGLFSLSWLTVSVAVNGRTRRDLLAPAGATLALGAIGAAIVVLARPLLPALFGHGEPALDVLAPLAVAMGLAGTTGVVTSMAVARGARRAWVPALVAVVLLAATAFLVRPDGAGFALGVLLAQVVGLAGGTWALLRSRSPAARANLLRFRGAEGGAAEFDRDAAIADVSLALPEAVVPPEPPPRRRRAPPEESQPSPARAFPWGAMLACCALATAACFTQAPGKIVADTKLDLYVEPLRFLARSLHLWDPTAAFGQIQDQAVGYLFPMGPFFAGALKAGLPAWVAQRLWMGLLVSLAAAGAARLAAALRIGTPSGWVAGGFVYGLSAFFVGQLASGSVGLLAGALVPWAILPLIAGARGASPRRAGALSGLAVLAMGGVNAACTLAVLPLPALYILTRRAGPRRRALLLWWVAGVVLACAWWAAALLFQGRFGLDFLRFTETAATTQATTSAFELLRGAGNWVAYLHLGRAWLPAGWFYATSPVAILATGALAAAGLAGLAWRALPERRFLVASLALGVVCVGAGYTGAASGIASAGVQSLLSGALGAQRNTCKFEPVVLLPLALGAMHLLRQLPAARARAVATGAVTVLVLLVALPFALGTVATEGSMRSVPHYWYRLANYLHEHASTTRALLLPASAFGEYDWGRPIDEPLESLARSPWAVRDLIPLGGIGSTQLLDALEGEIASGHSPAGLGQVLERAGVSYVVARNDLDWERANAPSPVEVDEALRAGGLRRVATFGPSVPGDTGAASLARPSGPTRVPSLEVYAVPERTAAVATYPQSGSILLNGGPQSLPQLASTPWLGRRAVLLASDLPAAAHPRGDVWVSSDASRRAGEDFGLVESNLSYTLRAGEVPPGGRDRGLQIVPPAPGARQASAVYTGGISSTSASSYGSWLLQLPELAPANAFDGDPRTAWVAGDASNSTGQWVQANLAKPTYVSGIAVRLLEDGPWRPVIRRITVSTEAGSLTSTVADTEAAQAVSAPAGETGYVRVTLAEVTGQSPAKADAGLIDVQIPGVSATIGGGGPYVAPPQEPALLRESAASGTAPRFLLTRLTANPANLERRDPEARFARQIQLARPSTMSVTGDVLPTPGEALDGLLTRERGLRVSASSSWGALPNFRAANALDGQIATSWVAAPPAPPPPNAPSAPGVGGPADVNRAPRVSPVPVAVDTHPALYLSWAHPATLDELRVVPGGGLAAPPTLLRLSSPAGTRLVPVRHGFVRFAPLRTDRLTVTFPGVAARYTTEANGTRVRLPVGVGELEFPALRALAPATLPPGGVLRLPCGKGPSMTIDGRSFEMALTATVRDVTALRPIPFTLCAPGATVSLPAGTSSIVGPGGEPFTLTDIALAPLSGQPAPTPRPRSVSVLRWGADSRELSLGAGAATYLAVRENFDAGWSATMGGRKLRAIRLEGWEQGFAIPAGAAGLVKLSFAPDRGYRLSLLVGGALALLLLLLALAPARRAVRARSLLAAAGSGWRTRVLFAVAATVAVGLLSVPALLAVPPIVALALWRPRLLAPLAAVAMLAATVLVAVTAAPVPAEEAGAFSAGAQILTSVAVGAVVFTLVARARPTTEGRRP